MLPVTVTAADLLAEELPSRALQVVDSALGRFPNTTMFLLALAGWLDSAAGGDEAGSKLVAEFAVRFAEHEVTTL